METSAAWGFHRWLTLPREAYHVPPLTLRSDARVTIGLIASASVSLYGGTAYSVLHQAIENTPPGWNSVITGTAGAITVLGLWVLAFLMNRIYTQATVDAYKDQAQKLLPALEKLGATVEELVELERRRGDALVRMESALGELRHQDHPRGGS